MEDNNTTQTPTTGNKMIDFNAYAAADLQEVLTLSDARNAAAREMKEADRCGDEAWGLQAYFAHDAADGALKALEIAAA